MTYSFFVGVDLGQSQDYTAIAVLEEACWIEEWFTNHKWAYRLGLAELQGREWGWTSPADISPSTLEQVLGLNYHEGKPPGAPLAIRHLERVPLGTDYPAVVEHVATLLRTPPLLDRRVALLVDHGGVGRSVVNNFQVAGLNPIPISVHAGEAVNYSREENAYRVPKRDLVFATKVLLQNGRLKIASQLREADTLRRELESYRVTIDPRTSHDSYSAWREKDHDDLVFATCLTCWFRQYWNEHLDVSNAS